MMYAVRFAVVALVWGVLLPAAAAAQTVPIPRDIDLGVHGRIVLGEPFTADSILEGARGGFRTLRSGTFAGADSIQVLLAGDRVAAIRFVYAPVKADFASYVANGTRAFGEPRRWREATESSGGTEYAVWDDAETAMELRLAVRGASIQLTALMSDHRLMDSTP